MDGREDSKRGPFPLLRVAVDATVGDACGRVGMAAGGADGSWISGSIQSARPTAPPSRTIV